MKIRTFSGLALGLALILLVLQAPAGSSEVDARPADCLLPEQISPVTLRAMFEQEGWRVGEDAKGLKLTDGKGHTVLVHWQKKGNFLSLVSWLNFKAFTSRAKKLELTNNINREVAFTRAAVDGDGDLRFDYWMDLSQGVCRPQLGSAGRTFIQASDAALRLQDKDDLVK